MPGLVASSLAPRIPRSGKITAPQLRCACSKTRSVWNSPRSGRTRARNLDNVRSSRWQRLETSTKCSAVLQEDAPYAVAIGVCMLSTLVLPSGDVKSDDETSVIGPNDVRHAAMGIISFIPLFDWLAWVFAWLDTSKRRYLVYSIVYLAPYFKSGLSLSTDDSWLPLASVLACIIHVQLEIAVNNEGLEQAQIKDSITRMLFEKTRVRELRERSAGLLTRLQYLAEHTTRPHKPHDEDADVARAPSAKQVAEKEFDEWDKKLLEKVDKDAAVDRVEE